MYRNIYYNIPKKYVKLWTWDEHGNRVSEEIPFSPYIYIENEKGTDGMSIFNKRLVKKTFRNSWDRDKYIKGSGLKRIFYNLKAEQQFLIDKYGSKNSDLEFSKYPLKIALHLDTPH